MAKLPAALAQKIAQSQLGSGPSLVPQAPVKEPEEVIPTVEELIGEAEDLETLRSLVAALVVPQAEVKRLEKVIDTIKPRIKVIVSQYGIAKALCGESTLSYFATSRSTINRTKLLAAGVDESIIEDCTDKTESFSLKVS
jgi:hypothetical protein